MRHTIGRTALAIAAFAGAAFAAQATCGADSKCPEDTPCCSLYNQCGVGAYCLGGCNPLFSHSLDSCVPSATCKSEDYKLTSLDDVESLSKYLGDNDGVNWVSSGNPLVYNDALLLTMAQDTVGTLLSSTHYVWYGKICAKMTTSQGAGVVTAFIMMSDVRDEIDFEFVGVDTEHAQSNYYSQGVTVYTNSKNLSAASTESTVHEYCIDWQTDSLTWSVDGTDLRTVKRSDTWNATANRFDYPQTPSRVMLSLWPAGLSSNGEGTINWAGGLIDWSSKYMQNGYYYAMVEEVTVDCYDAPSGAQGSGTKSYVYTGTSGTNNTVELSDDTVVLKSFYATGENPNYDPNGSSQTSSGKAAATSAVVETIPGVSGVGNQGSSSNNNPADSSDDSAATTGTSSSSSSSSSGGFSQGNDGGSTGGAAETKGAALGGSLFAVWVGVFALLVL